MSDATPGGRQSTGETPATWAAVASSQARSAKVDTSRRASSATRAPSDLLPQSKELWHVLHERNDFQPQEDAVLEQALLWKDESARLRAEARTLKGTERAARLRSAGDAATVSLRYLRVLKFTDPTRPPGRSPGRRPHLPISSLTIGGGNHADGAR